MRYHSEGVKFLPIIFLFFHHPLLSFAYSTLSTLSPHFFSNIHVLFLLQYLHSFAPSTLFSLFSLVFPIIFLYFPHPLLSFVYSSLSILSTHFFQHTLPFASSTSPFLRPLPHYPASLLSFFSILLLSLPHHLLSFARSTLPTFSLSSVPYSTSLPHHLISFARSTLPTPSLLAYSHTLPLPLLSNRFLRSFLLVHPLTSYVLFLPSFSLLISSFPSYSPLYQSSLQLP